MITTSAATALTDQLGIRLPIIQAPMAGTSSAAMAAEVTSSGGLGSIGIGTLDVDAAAKLVGEVRARTPGPFNVNVFCHRPAERDPAQEAAWIAYLRPEFDRLRAAPPAQLGLAFDSFVENEDMLRLLVRERPAVVSFHFGLPSQAAIDALHDSGCFLLGTATNLDEARTLVKAGIDGVVAQGHEAGGHRGMFDPDRADEFLGRVALTRLLVRHVAVPIISAGGIMDGVGIACALRLGASAAQLGSAFIATDESSASATHRALLAGAHTVMTRAISGRPARAIVNRLSTLGMGAPASSIPPYPIPYAVALALDAAGRAAGEPGLGAYWAGQRASLARALPTAELVASLARELESAWLQNSVGASNHARTRYCSR